MKIADYHTDEQLLLLLSDGAKKAFEEIYNRYWDKLFVVAAYRLNDKHEAEEVVQEVMLNLWRKRDDLHIEYSLGTYLAAAAKYEVINRLAKRRRSQQYQESTAANSSEADLSTEHQLEFSALQHRLARLVKALPKKCQLVFTLSREEGLSQREIAEQLKVSENTVESHMKKALRRIRVGLGHFLF